MGKKLAPFVVKADNPKPMATVLRELASMLESGKISPVSGGILLSPRQHPTDEKTVEITVFSDLVLHAKQ